MAYPLVFLIFLFVFIYVFYLFICLRIRVFYPEVYDEVFGGKIFLNFTNDKKIYRFIFRGGHEAWPLDRKMRAMLAVYKIAIFLYFLFFLASFFVY